MKQLIILFAEITSVVAVAANLEPVRNEPSPTAVMCVANPVAKDRAVGVVATEKNKKLAARCGIPFDKWCKMSKKARKEARQKAIAKEKAATALAPKAEAKER